MLASAFGRTRRKRTTCFFLASAALQSLIGSVRRAKPKIRAVRTSFEMVGYFPFPR